MGSCSAQLTESSKCSEGIAMQLTPLQRLICATKIYKSVSYVSGGNGGDAINTWSAK